MVLHITKVKIFCLFFFVGLAITVLISNNRFVGKINAEIPAPPQARTGAPGETTCTSCHTPTASTGGQFTITAPANYTAGQTYQITVRHVTADTTRKRWGFEMVSLANNVSVGNLAVTNANSRIINGSNGRQYVGHTQAGTFQNQGGGAVWAFNWTAPATNIGPVTFYAAGIQSNNNGNESGDQTYTTTATLQPAVPPTPTTHTIDDFDGDGKTDPSVIRNQSNNALWYIKTPTTVTTQQFGLMTDKFVPADYDGDGKTDAAVFRDGIWWILNSSNNTVRIEQFGVTNDVPVTGDYDGDGKADLTVYRQGIWYLKQSSNDVVRGQQWGVATDKPVTGDYDGDGKSDIAVWRPATSDWWVYQSSNGVVISIRHGLPGDIPTPGDYDGDGRTNIAVYRPSNGTWYTSTDVNNNYYGAIPWGISTDIPVQGNYDGDNKTDIAVYRNGIWYIRMSSNTTMNAQVFGASTDVPVPSLQNQ